MKAAMLCLLNFRSSGVTSETIRDRGRSARLFLAQSQLRIRPKERTSSPGLFPGDLDYKYCPHLSGARHKAGHERGQVPAYQLKPRSLQ